VFAGTVAFAGTAAAATNESVSIDTSSVDTSGAEFTVTGTTEAGSDSDYFTFYAEGADLTEVTASDVTFTAGDQTSPVVTVT